MKRTALCLSLVLGLSSQHLHADVAMGRCEPSFSGAHKFNYKAYEPLAIELGEKIRSRHPSIASLEFEPVLIDILIKIESELEKSRVKAYNNATSGYAIVGSPIESLGPELWWVDANSATVLERISARPFITRVIRMVTEDLLLSNLQEDIDTVMSRHATEILLTLAPKSGPAKQKRNNTFRDNITYEIPWTLN